VQRQIAGIPARMARSPTPAPERMAECGAVRGDEELRKREGEANVTEEMDGVEMEGGGDEDGGNGAPLTKVLSRAACGDGRDIDRNSDGGIRSENRTLWSLTQGSPSQLMALHTTTATAPAAECVRACISQSAT